MEMTPGAIKKICQDCKGYGTAYLNDVLYLHHKVSSGGGAAGFAKIENLEPYTGLKVRVVLCVRLRDSGVGGIRFVLWLEANGLRRIEGLEAQTSLRALMLHENAIARIENLEHLVDLTQLNLSDNCIDRIEGLSPLTKLEATAPPAAARLPVDPAASATPTAPSPLMHIPLASSLHVPCAQTLTIANNQLETAEDIRAVADLPALACLDLKGNIIDDPAVLDVLAAMPSLRVLYLQGNPVVKRIRHYRKTVISRLEGLRFLDDRPVFDEERERVTAWAAGMKAGGSKEAAARERATIAAQKQRAREADERNFRAFEAMVRSHAAPGETEARTEAYLESAEAATAVATAAEREARGPEGALPWETTPLPAEAFVQASRAAEAAGAAAASAAA
ncbi:DNAAF1, partial [Symbiodinium sp. KB8]